MTAPGDTISVNLGSSPASEQVGNIIDNNVNSKYLNIAGPGSGLIVTPASGASNVTGITVTSANDVPDRDPASFTLYGRADEALEFVPIATGTIPPFRRSSIFERSSSNPSKT